MDTKPITIHLELEFKYIDDCDISWGEDLKDLTSKKSGDFGD